MSPKILITGGAGYIGGSIIAELLSQKQLGLQPSQLSTTVRSQEQVKALSKLRVQVLQIDIDDKASVLEAILKNEIDIVIHAASSAVPGHVHSLVQALGQRREQSGKEVYYIHSGIMTTFSEEGGWPFGEIKDSEDVFEKENSLDQSFPVRVVDVAVVEESKAQNVTAFNVVVPAVHGRGSGEGRKISIPIPAFIRSSIKHKTVHKFDIDSRPPHVHISDLSRLYVLIVDKILKNEKIPSGEQGYYFGFSHRSSMWSFMQRLATSLHDRGLVSKPEVETWPSYDDAAESLGWPRQFVRAMGTHSGQQIAVNAYEHLGWQPEWDEKKFLDSVDQEVDDVIKFDVGPSSLFKSLTEASAKNE